MLKVVVDVVLTKCTARQEVAEAVVQRGGRLGSGC